MLIVTFVTAFEGLTESMLQNSLNDFYASSLGQYAVKWEQVQFDKMVSDCFGYTAIQLGATTKHFLRDNRIGLHIVGDPDLQALALGRNEDFRVRIQMLFEEMPFETESLDLVVMPHTLEIVEDPHALLREVQRVLIPGGKVVLTGFNMMSLWGLRVNMQKLGAKKFLPGKQFMSVFQVRDWLHLLSFQVDRGTFGRYGGTSGVYHRKEDSWLEKAGDRWWPQCGALYALAATKVVPGSKFVGKAINRKFFFLGAGARAKMHRESQG